MTPCMEAPVDDALYFAQASMTPGPLPTVLWNAQLDLLLAAEDARTPRITLGLLLISASYFDPNDKLAMCLERIAEAHHGLRRAVCVDTQAEQLEARVWDLWDLLRGRLGDERVDEWFTQSEVAA